MGLTTQSARENFNYELLLRKFCKFKRNSCSTLVCNIFIWVLKIFRELGYWAPKILKHRIFGPKGVLIANLILGTVLMLNRTKMSLNCDVKRFLGTSFKSSVVFFQWNACLGLADLLWSLFIISHETCEVFSSIAQDLSSDGHDLASLESKGCRNYAKLQQRIIYKIKNLDIEHYVHYWI